MVAKTIVLHTFLFQQVSAMKMYVTINKSELNTLFTIHEVN